MQVEKYEDSDDFFGLFEHDTFDKEETLEASGQIGAWRGYVNGKVVAGYNYTNNEGWYDDTVI